VTAYADLARRFRRMGAVGGALAVLEWDRSAMMPDGGADARAEQVATLSVIHHELLTDPRLAALLDEAEGDTTLDDWGRANLREMRNKWRHANALPADLVEARARAVAACEMVWRKARADDDFAGFAPAFAEVLRLTREVAAAKARTFALTPYDALVQEYEPGAGAALFDPIFADLADFLPGFLARALERQAQRPAVQLPEGPFPTAAQRELGLKFMAALGFDFHHGRLDVSLHPFTGGVPQDVRLTTRYREDDFTGALMGVLHETGHALYELGLPTAWAGQPVGEARGMIMHESQSLLVEMQVCRGPAFIRYAAPQLRAAFGGSGPAWSEDNLARLYTRVRPGLIRVDADEVCYPAHVILRYRLERALLSGDLAIADLPGAWRDGMKQLLGVTVPNDRDGCLQDIHWPSGSFGYFPTYTFGALAAAQLFAAARAQDPDIVPGIGRGDFGPLLRWLRQNVHGLGSLLSTDELVHRATGAPLGVAAFKRHLEQRYLA
jgi:carboxypeptidase Taq